MSSEKATVDDEAPKTHPNGRPFREKTKTPTRDDTPFKEDIFPDTRYGRLLKGLLLQFLCKQEHRSGWVDRLASSDIKIPDHPNETVSAHQWGVALLVAELSQEPEFQETYPEFNLAKAMKMALTHDLAEIITRDIHPRAGVSVEEKHRREKEAMVEILGQLPSPLSNNLKSLYDDYEERRCDESKFVKDCDKIDLLLTGFMLERQGFSWFNDFYENTSKTQFFTPLADKLMKLLLKTRAELIASKQMYKAKVPVAN